MGMPISNLIVRIGPYTKVLQKKNVYIIIV